MSDEPEFTTEFWRGCADIRHLGGDFHRVAATPDSPVENIIFEAHSACQALIAQHRCALVCPPFPVFIVSSDVCNAAAVTHAGSFAVFFTSGLLDHLSRCLRLFICTSKLLRENFGRSQVLDEGMWSADARHFRDHAEPNEVRYFYQCLGRAIEFIWFHEVAHRIRAHAQLAVSSSGTAAFEEIYWMSNADKAVDASVRHQCEIDADIIAARFCMEGDVKAAAMHDAEENHDFWLSEMGVRLIALLNTFVLLDSSITDRRIVYDRYYPPLLHRAILVSSAITDAYAKNGDMDKDFAKGVEAQIWIDIAAVADWLKMPSGDWANPQTGRINLEDLNSRLAGFRNFQDRLDADLDQRLAGANPITQRLD